MGGRRLPLIEASRPLLTRSLARCGRGRNGRLATLISFPEFLFDFNNEVAQSNRCPFHKIQQTVSLSLSQDLATLRTYTRFKRIRDCAPNKGRPHKKEIERESLQNKG